MLGICFFSLGENTLKASLQEGEKGVVEFSGREPLRGGIGQTSGLDA